MFQENTIVTDILSIIGLVIIVLSPFYFSMLHRKILNGRLHTKVDGEKLFEKLKYDLKLSKITGVDKKRLYRDVDYAKTIFRGAMEYNSRELVLYFNELFAKRFIHKTINNKSLVHFLIWIVTIGIIMGGSLFDLWYWLTNMKSMDKSSGIVSIWVMFFIAFIGTGINKFLEFFKVKTVVNDEVRRINLAKKEKVWKDYVIVFWCSIGTGVFGFLLIFINIFIT